MNFSDFSCEVYRLLLQDWGNRGLLSHLSPRPLPDVLQLLSADRVGIVSGFPVQAASGRICGETDGPSGTAHLAHALLAAGKEVFCVTDPLQAPLFRAALGARAPEATLVILSAESDAADFRQLLWERQPELLIALERPGKAADGHFYSMGNCIRDAAIIDTDPLFVLAKEKGISTLAIGDGGNELGMGQFRREIHRYVPHGAEICAAFSADLALAAGISNWWGWGLAALLSYHSGKNLLPDAAAEAETLAAVVAAGGVDGLHGRQECSVDGFPLARQLTLLASLQELVEAALREPICC